MTARTPRATAREMLLGARLLAALLAGVAFTSGAPGLGAFWLGLLAALVGVRRWRR